MNSHGATSGYESKKGDPPRKDFEEQLFRSGWTSPEHAIAKVNREFHICFEMKSSAQLSFWNQSIDLLHYCELLDWPHYA